MATGRCGLLWVHQASPWTGAMPSPKPALSSHISARAEPSWVLRLHLCLVLALKEPCMAAHRPDHLCCPSWLPQPSQAVGAV